MGEMTYTQSFMIYQNTSHKMDGILPEAVISEHAQLTINGRSLSFNIHYRLTFLVLLININSVVLPCGMDLGFCSWEKKGGIATHEKVRGITELLQHSTK